MTPMDSGGKDVRIPLGKITLEGNLVIPSEAEGIVIFAHGSGSSRFSKRNQFVARHLQSNGLATLLCDLLTREEEEIDTYTGSLRFDIGLLAGRLSDITQWVVSQQQLQHVAVGYFGASTGAAAAMIAETRNQGAVHAVVSRGGRPDLSGKALGLVRAPTLFIVGGNDYQVITLNEQAMELLNATKEMVIVPGATHLFEESGALESVGRLSSRWFLKYLSRDRQTQQATRNHQP
jgi:putative phosphoribosyl transferase